MKARALLSALIILLIPILPAVGETALETLAAAHLWGDAERAIMEIKLDIDTGRGEKSRTLEVYFDNRALESKLFARVTVPAFLNQMKYLYTRSSNGAESKWVSTSRGTRQLSNAQRTEKLFDSDFTTEDLSKLNIDDYVVTFAPTSSAETIVVTATAKEERNSSRVITIDPDTMLITRVEYLDAAGKTERVYEVLETRTSGDIVTVSACSMTDVETGTTTVLTVESFDSDTEIPDRVFSRASL